MTAPYYYYVCGSLYRVYYSAGEKCDLRLMHETRTLFARVPKQLIEQDVALGVATTATESELSLVMQFANNILNRSSYE